MTESRHILQFLSRSNFFIQSHSLDSPVYQYHALFREYLIARAKKTFSEEDLHVIRRKAAQLLAETGRYEEAAALFLEDKAWGEMANLVLGHAQALIAQGRFATLYAWLTGFPSKVWENNSWLLFWMGASRLPFDPQASEAHFTRSFEMFVAEQDPAGILLAWSGVVDAIFYSNTHYSRFDFWIQKLDELKHLYDTFPIQEIKARVAASLAAALTFRQSLRLEPETWAKDVLLCPDDQIDINAKIHTFSWYIYYQTIMEAPSETQQSIELLKQLTKRPGVSHISRITCCFIEAAFNQWLGFHDECLRLAHEGLKLSETTGVHLMDSNLLGHAVSSFLNRSDMNGARIYIQKMGSTVATTAALDQSFYYLVKSREAMIRGNLKEALNHAKIAIEMNCKAGSLFHEGLGNAFCAQLLHLPGQEKEAKDYLQEAFRVADRSQSIVLKFFALYARARLALAWNDMSLCTRTLKEAFSIGKKGLLLVSIFDNPSVTAQLCAIALEHDIEVEYVKEIIRRRGLVLHPLPFHIDQWPWQFRVYTMGRFELHHHDGPVPFSRKAQKKPLELLKVLVASRGKEVSEEQIADLLWPEADGDAGYAAFKTNLSRLRHILGNDEVIRFQDGKVTIDPHSCWVDAWTFEHMAAAAEKGWKQNSSENFTFAKKAMNLYQGHFLSSDGDTFPVVAYREHLRDVYLRLVTRVGEHLKKSSQWEEALAYFMKGLEVDPLIEEFYQEMMVCYEKLDQPSRAIETYHRCRKILASALGCDPSPRTQALYRSLRPG
jgi:DNA-binding SARP family transcriptional activator